MRVTYRRTNGRTNRTNVDEEKVMGFVNMRKKEELYVWTFWKKEHFGKKELEIRGSVCVYV